ncbi:MAG TPA: hypothetical protein VE623_00720 [Acidimicrobiales bacterium]|nr:hypothetical protein [Acidimicrobiales bacterium]
MLLSAPHAPVAAAPPVPWGVRLRWWAEDHGAGVGAVAAIAVVTVAFQGVNLGTAPPPAEVEGALVAGGWSMAHLGSAGEATFSPTGTSLAPVHLGAWMWATGGLGRASTAIAAGREAMLVAHTVGIPLVWLLARRSGLARWAAGAAAVLFTASPLAIALHRPVSAAGLTVPWMLAGLVLASSRRPRPWTVIGAGVCLAVAALTEPVAVVVAPAAGWLLWRSSPSATRRRRRLLLGAAAFGLVWLALTAVATGGGTPGPGAPLDLLDRIRLVVDSRSSSSVLGTGAGGLDGRSAVDLIGLDRVGAAVTLLAAVVVPSVIPRLRPIGGAFGACAALALVADEPSAAVVVLMVPLGALLLAAGAQLVWAWHVEAHLEPRLRSHRVSGAVRRLDAAVPLVFAAAAVVGAVALPDWVASHGDLMGGGPTAPLAHAVDWVAGNLGDGETVIVDEVAWVDVVEGGLDPSRLATYGAVGGGAAWRSYDYIVATPALRHPGAPPALAAAVEGSRPVARVGEGADRVEVRRISRVDAESVTAGEVPPPDEALATAGAALATNPAIEAPPAALAQLRAGEVDGRLTTVLATLAGAHRLEIGAFLRLPSEAVAGAPVRTVELVAIDGRPISADDPAVVEVVAFLGNQRPEFRPEQADVVSRTGGEPRLRITFPVGQEDQE